MASLPNQVTLDGKRRLPVGSNAGTPSGGQVAKLLASFPSENPPLVLHLGRTSQGNTFCRKYVQPEENEDSIRITV